MKSERMISEKFKFEDIFGSATTVIFAINCIINCDITAIINVNLFEYVSSFN